MFTNPSVLNSNTFDYAALKWLLSEKYQILSVEVEVRPPFLG